MNKIGDINEAKYGSRLVKLRVGVNECGYYCDHRDHGTLVSADSFFGNWSVRWDSNRVLNNGKEYWPYGTVGLNRIVQHRTSWWGVLLTQGNPLIGIALEKDESALEENLRELVNTAVKQEIAETRQRLKRLAAFPT